MENADTELPELTPFERRSLEIDLALHDLWALLSDCVCVGDEEQEDEAGEYLDLTLVAQALRVAYDRGGVDAKAQICDESCDDGYEKGHAEGRDEGYDAGYEEGYEMGYAEGLSDGRDDSIAAAA